MCSACVAADYGAGACAAWDCTEEEEYCARQWCYVDPANCDRTHAPSHFFPGRPLAYSYGTCGFPDWAASDNPDWMMSALRRALGGAALRVAYPEDQLPTLHTHCDEAGRCTREGSTSHLMRHIFQAASIATATVPVSNASHQAFPLSSYDACVHEVNVGGADLCVGAFWSTYSRMDLAAFTGPVDTDNFFLLTFVGESSKPFQELIATPFKPFSPELWAAVVGTFALLTFAQRLVKEDKEEQGDEQPAGKAMEALSSSGPSTLILSKPTSLLEAPGLGRKANNDWVPNGRVEKVMKGLGMPNPKAIEQSLDPANIIAATSELFKVLVVSGYTANMASIFVLTGVSYSLRSLDEAIGKGLKICTLSALQTLLTNKFPSIAELLVVVSAPGQVVEAMDRGECTAGIITEMQLNALQRQSLHTAHVRRLLTQPATNCDKSLVGGTLLTQGQAMPVRPDLQHVLSLLMAVFVQDGTYQQFLEEAIDKYMGPYVCGGKRGGYLEERPWRPTNPESRFPRCWCHCLDA